MKPLNGIVGPPGESHNARFASKGHAIFSPLGGDMRARPLIRVTPL
jgi:hypothetical protein